MPAYALIEVVIIRASRTWSQTESWKVEKCMIVHVLRDLTCRAGDGRGVTVRNLKMRFRDFLASATRGESIAHGNDSYSGMSIYRAMGTGE